MSRRFFERGLRWRAERDRKVRERRAALGFEWDGSAPGGGASAAEHVASYWEYRRHVVVTSMVCGIFILSRRLWSLRYWACRRLVGEADGGELLPPQEIEKLRALAREAAKNRLFVTWRSIATGLDCYNVGPDSRCFCGPCHRVCEKRRSSGHGDSPVRCSSAEPGIRDG